MTRREMTDASFKIWIYVAITCYNMKLSWKYACTCRQASLWVGGWFSQIIHPPKMTWMMDVHHPLWGGLIWVIFQSSHLAGTCYAHKANDLHPCAQGPFNPEWWWDDDFLHSILTYPQRREVVWCQDACLGLMAIRMLKSTFIFKSKW